MNEVPTKKLSHEVQQYSWLAETLAKWFPIFGSHVKRIGLLRTFLGGVPMYISIPFFAVWHLFCLYIFSTLMLQPILGLKKLRFKDFVIIDRHKIAGLPWFDRFNCMYCGYANGLVSFYEARLSQVDEWEGELSFTRKLVLFLGFILIHLPFTFLNKIDHAVTYDTLISRPLGLHRISKNDAIAELDSWDNQVVKNRGWVNRIIRSERVFSIRLNGALEQIESSWCPFKHADNRPEVRYPKHHENFLERHDIQTAKDILSTDGTVSHLKPYR
jgi:hypothetical protein